MVVFIGCRLFESGEYGEFFYCNWVVEFIYIFICFFVILFFIFYFLDLVIEVLGLM